MAGARTLETTASRQLEVPRLSAIRVRSPIVDNATIEAAGRRKASPRRSGEASNSSRRARRSTGPGATRHPGVLPAAPRSPTPTVIRSVRPPWPSTRASSSRRAASSCASRASARREAPGVESRCAWAPRPRRRLGARVEIRTHGRAGGPFARRPNAPFRAQTGGRRRVGRSVGDAEGARPAIGGGESAANPIKQRARETSGLGDRMVNEPSHRVPPQAVCGRRAGETTPFLRARRESRRLPRASVRRRRRAK